MEIFEFDIRKLKARDEAEWTRVYDECADAVFGFLYRRVGNRREAAKDLTQQTFLTAYKEITKFDGKGSDLIVWLLGIAKNYNRYFRHERWETPVSVLSSEESGGSPFEAVDPTNPREELARIQEDDLLEGILAAMPEKYEQALRLRYCEELSHREIGKRLDLTEKAAEMTVRRGRSYLQQAFFRCYPFLAPPSSNPQECAG